jgi:hypothetical protein
MKRSTEGETQGQRATTPDLFQICRRYYSEPVARVASELLFWSQCGCNKLRGREGFFKEDADLVRDIGKHASSIRRTLSRICTKVGEDRPGALFEIAHGPRPWERSGRVRWLFRMPRGDEMIREALLLAEARDQRRQNYATDRSASRGPVKRVRTHRSAQNERTLYIQKDISESHSESRSESLSTKQERREKNQPKYLKKEDREKLDRFVERWNVVCKECNEPMLAWLPSDIERLATRLIEVIHHLGIAEMPDEDLLKRLRLLCGKSSRSVFAGMGQEFSAYNPNGLVIDTFANFGPKAWRAVETELAKREKIAKLNAPLRSLSLSPAKKPEPPLDIDRELERLTTNWEKACLERNRPELLWSTKEIEQRSSGLRTFIKSTRLNRFSDDELLAHLGNVVEALAAIMNMFPEVQLDSPPPPIHTFVFKGDGLFKASVDASRKIPQAPPIGQ